MHQPNPYRLSALLTAILLAAIGSYACAGEAQEGGLDGIKNFQRHAAGIATAGTLTREDLAALKRNGYQHIIDLRRPEEGTAEEAAWAAELELEYHNFPVGGEQPQAGIVEQVETVLSAANGEPVMLHCASGNRAGVVLGMLMHRRGASIEEALDYARSAGTRPVRLEQLETYLRGQ